MSFNRSLFSSASEHWATPKDLYEALDKEFHFNNDPCPLRAMTDGLAREWGNRVYVNPPYGRKITVWVKRAYEESLRGKLVVMLIPSRTDTQWWHEYIMKASEIRFLKGRLKFGDSKNSAPFPSVVVVFSPVLYAGSEVQGEGK